MTRERLNHLLDMVDEVNSKVNAAVSIEHGKYDDRIHITMFYARVNGEATSVEFTDYKFGSTHDFIIHEDTDLIKGEAFMRLLLASAEHCEVMRNDPGTV